MQRLVTIAGTGINFLGETAAQYLHPSLQICTLSHALLWKSVDFEEWSDRKTLDQYFSDLALQFSDRSIEFLYSSVSSAMKDQRKYTRLNKVIWKIILITRCVQKSSRYFWIFKSLEFGKWFIDETFAKNDKNSVSIYSNFSFIFLIDQTSASKYCPKLPLWHHQQLESHQSSHIDAIEMARQMIWPGFFVMYVQLFLW